MSMPACSDEPVRGRRGGARLWPAIGLVACVVATASACGNRSQAANATDPTTGVSSITIESTAPTTTSEAPQSASGTYSPDAPASWSQDQNRDGFETVTYGRMLYLMEETYGMSFEPTKITEKANTIDPSNPEQPSVFGFTSVEYPADISNAKAQEIYNTWFSKQATVLTNLLIQAGNSESTVKSGSSEEASLTYSVQDLILIDASRAGFGLQAPGLDMRDSKGGAYDGLQKHFLDIANDPKYADQKQWVVFSNKKPAGDSSASGYPITDRLDIDLGYKWEVPGTYSFESRTAPGIALSSDAISYSRQVPVDIDPALSSSDLAANKIVKDPTAEGRGWKSLQDGSLEDLMQTQKVGKERLAFVNVDGQLKAEIYLNLNAR